MQEYLVAHDLGTTSNKATLFSVSGELVKSITQSYGTRYFNGNWAEQNPLDWWGAVCICNKRLLADVDKTRVAGVAFSGQMMGCVLVDRSGSVLRDAIIWADQRSLAQEQQMRDRIEEKEFYHITGHKISASYSLEKLMWVRDNEPELFRNVYKMLLPKDYIIRCLTGAYVTDYSDASGTNALDLMDCHWSGKILEAAEISEDLMPELHTSTYTAGEVSRKVSEECGLAPGTKIIMGGGDGVCASVGAASVEEGVAYNYMGSSSWISFTSKTPFFDEEMRTFNWAHLVPGMYAPTGTMQAAGNSWSFMKEVLCDGLDVQVKEKNVSVYQLMDDLLSKTQAGAKGLIYLPYLLGERSPRWDPYARGALIGLKMEHTKGDILRAAMEGILMNLCIILDIFRVKASISSINLIGGLAKGAPVRRILADIYGIPAHKLNYLDEATSIGAAVAAGVGSGVLKDFSAIHLFIKAEDSIEPDPIQNAEYRKLKEIFESSYHALKYVYKQLSDIN